MKQRFLIHLLLVIGLTAAASAAIVGGYGHHRMRTLYETQQAELIEALKDRLIAFDRMIRLVESRMRADAEAATRAIAEVLMPDGKIPTDPADPSPPPLLDQAALLERLDHDAGLCREVIRVFLDDLPRRMAALRRQVEDGNAADIAASAHTVKGAFANISSPRLQSLAADLETAARSAGPDGASDETASFSNLFISLDRDFDALRAELTACLNTLDGDTLPQSGERKSI